MMNSTDFLENKITNDETMTVAELLTCIVNDITDLNERLKVCEHMLYLDDESFENLKVFCIKTFRSDLIYEGFFIFTFLCSLKTKYPAI